MEDVCQQVRRGKQKTDQPHVNTKLSRSSTIQTPTNTGANDRTNHQLLDTVYTSAKRETIVPQPKLPAE